MARRKDIYDSAVTLHITVKERTNIILLDIATEKESTKSRIIETLLKESKTFRQKYKELKKEGII